MIINFHLLHCSLRLIHISTFGVLCSKILPYAYGLFIFMFILDYNIFFKAQRDSHNTSSLGIEYNKLYLLDSNTHHTG